MKKRIYTFLIVMATVTFGLTGCMTEMKVERQLALGAANLEQGNYDEAITAYEEAIALDKYEIAGYEGIVTAMAEDGRGSDEIVGVVLGATSAMEEMNAQEEGMSEEEKAAAENFYMQAAEAVAGDTEAELTILESGVGVLGEESQLADSYETKVEELVDYYLEGNNLEEAKQYADQLATTLPSNEEAQEMATTVTEKAEAEQELVDILMTAYEYIQNEDWASLQAFGDSEEFAAIREKVGEVGSYIYIFDGGNTGSGIGYYSIAAYDETYDVWYVGDYMDGERSGNGGWYRVYLGGANEEYVNISTYVGEWADDAPNGSGHKYVASETEVFVDEDITVVNGLYSGTYTEKFEMDDGTILIGTYEMVDGKYVEIEVDDYVKEYVSEDYYPYCVVYFTDQNGKERFWLASAPKGSIAGIFPYYCVED